MLWETSAAGAMQEPGGFARIVFPLASVRDVRVGKGWSRGGIGAVIWPVVKGIDSLAKDHAVSFEGPDPVTGRYVVYAIHMYDKADAEKLAGLLGG